MPDNQQNISSLLRFVSALLQQRLLAMFNKEAQPPFVYPEFQLASGNPAIDELQTQYQLTIEEVATLLIVLAPHIQPNFFDSIVQEFIPQGGEFAEIGGVKGSNHRGMLPTGETVQFILAGNDFDKRLETQKILISSALIKQNILSIETVKEGEPTMSGRMIISEEWLNKILFGKTESPRFSPDFPAKKLSTEMGWDDLVLNPYTSSQICDIQIWLQHNDMIMQDKILKKKIKPGYRVLFYGPSGTGKTLTATLLGKQFDKDVYRIDISQMVSKYIGETEKNLEKVFAKAEHKNWILFFDEADALFGKRTNVQSSHDRYANQEVSYLLQRIEDYAGLLILASNFKSNMDDAFLRRFHSIIHFPPPKPAERLRLWQKTLPAAYKPEPAININELSEKYDLNGASILNIMHYAVLKSASRADEFIRQTDILDAIRKEYRKEERSVN